MFNTYAQDQQFIESFTRFASALESLAESMKRIVDEELEETE